MINILVQDRGMHLLRVCEDTDIQKRQQESKERMMCLPSPLDTRLVQTGRSPSKLP